MSLLPFTGSVISDKSFAFQSFEAHFLNYFGNDMKLLIHKAASGCGRQLMSVGVSIHWKVLKCSFGS